MNGPEHNVIVTLGLQALPDWAAEIWQPMAEDVLGSCMLPDQKAIALLRGETGPWRRYFPKRAWRLHFDAPQSDWRAAAPDTRFYLRRIVSNLRKGDRREAARFAGVYSHWIADFAQPAHHYDLEIATLLPPPASMRNCEYHRMVEDIPSTVSQLRYRPRVLGRSQAECLFRLSGRYEALFRKSVAALIPMTRAIYRRRHAPATRLLNGLVHDAAALFADFCCTALVLAGTPLPGADRRRLSTCDLREVAPDLCDVEYNFGHMPLRDWITVESYGRARPLSVYRGEGDAVVEEPVRGICTIPHALPLETVEPVAWLEYRLPKATFARFHCDAGLLSGIARQAAATFEVSLDGRRVCDSGLLTPGQPAVALEADVRGGRKLRLHVRTDGSTDKLAYPVWAKPRLEAITKRAQSAARSALSVCVAASLAWLGATCALADDSPAGGKVVAAANGQETADAARRLQAQAAETSGTPVAITITLAPGVDMAFRFVPPGSFPQGRRSVRITRPFHIGVHEVTQAQWEAVMGHNPSYFSDRDDSPSRPVERVSWDDIADSFLPAVQVHAPADMCFRLPSEAEWEHACRAGTGTPWAFGDRITPALANTGDSDLRQTVAVGCYPANAWGLYDMHGNVSEWCVDWYDAKYYQRAPTDDPVNRDQPEYGRKRVMRGGSWLNDAYNTRSNERLRHLSNYRNINTGFRLVLDFGAREGMR